MVLTTQNTMLIGQLSRVAMRQIRVRSCFCQANLREALKASLQRALAALLPFPTRHRTGAFELEVLNRRESTLRYCTDEITSDPGLIEEVSRETTNGGSSK